MKTSLRLIIWKGVMSPCDRDVENCGVLAFSCWMCFSSLSSLYVLLLRTGVLKGFMIFFIATDAPVS